MTRTSGPRPAPALPVPTAPQFPVLDTLRLVGALAVLTTHVAFQSGAYVRHGIWGSLLARLDVGVAIFFVLSGFLLARPWLARRADALPHPPTRRYYWKRLLRIYPVYVVTVIIALALIPENADLGVRDWARTLLLANVYADAPFPQGLTQMWSLAVEVAFYLLLPLLMLAALGRRGPLSTRRVLVVLALMVAVTCWWHLDGEDRASDVFAGAPGQWLPAYLSWFAVGIGLALAHVRHQQGRGGRLVLRMRMLAALPGACWVLAGALLVVAATPVAGPTLLFVPTSAESLTKNVLYALIGGLLVLTGVFTDPRGVYRPVMSHRLLRHLGHISYSTFCIHLPVLYLVMEVGDYRLFGGQGLEIWAWTLVLSLAASEVLYRLVEKPAQRLRNVRSRRGEASQPSTTEQAATTR